MMRPDEFSNTSASPTQWVTSSTLLQNLQTFHNEAAWSGFAARFVGPIKSFALRMGLPASDVDDASQDVLMAFAEAYRGGHYDRSKGRLSSWLFGIAYRQIANFRRKRLNAQQKQDARGAHTTFWAEFPDEHAAQNTWHATWESSVLQACMNQVRAEVAENTYRAFEMTVRQQQPPEHVAEILGMTRNAVYVAKHRVLNRLQELMKQYEDAAIE